MPKITHPQEIVVWNIIPLLRRTIAYEMKNQGLDQKRIAFLLSVTEAAVSQYFNEKRAQHKMKMSKQLKSEILISTLNIIRDKNAALYEIQRLIDNNEIKNYVCSLHKKEFGAPSNCPGCSMIKK